VVYNIVMIMSHHYTEALFKKQPVGGSSSHIFRITWSALIGQ